MEETSKKVRHTEGQWHFKYFEKGDMISIFTDAPSIDTSICGIWGITGDNPKSSDEQLANAHLIAAAPSLLEALENLVKANPNDTTWNYPAAYDSAINAIKLAKGEIKTELI